MKSSLIWIKKKLIRTFVKIGVLNFFWCHPTLKLSYPPEHPGIPEQIQSRKPMFRIPGQNLDQNRVAFLRDPHYTLIYRDIEIQSYRDIQRYIENRIPGQNLDKNREAFLRDSHYTLIYRDTELQRYIEIHRDIQRTGFQDRTLTRTGKLSLEILTIPCVKIQRFIEIFRDIQRTGFQDRTLTRTGWLSLEILTKPCVEIQIYIEIYGDIQRTGFQDRTFDNSVAYLEILTIP